MVLDKPHARIALKSPGYTPTDNPRRLGVAVETVNLFQDDWPLTDNERREARGAIRTTERLVTPREVGTPVQIEVANLGKSTWMPADNARNDRRAVQLALRWQVTDRRVHEREQRLNLPWPLYPTDRALIDAPLVPPDELRPVELDGTDVPIDSALVVDVIAPRR